MRSTKYEVYISGTPRPAGDRPHTAGAATGAAAGSAAAGSAAAGNAAAGRMPGAEPPPIHGDGAGYGQGVPHASVNPPPRPVVRRFAPVLQFLTSSDPLVEQQLQSLVTQAHRKSLTLQQICEEVYHYTRTLGYEVALGVQEVYSTGMPSFPDQTVKSALILVDLWRIQAPDGYHHRSRRAS